MLDAENQSRDTWLWMGNRYARIVGPCPLDFVMDSSTTAITSPLHPTIIGTSDLINLIDMLFAMSGNKCANVRKPVDQ